MKRREKPYSLEEDLALDAKIHFDRMGGRTEEQMRYMGDRWEGYDPGGKRAREITNGMLKKYRPGSLSAQLRGRE
ncbi:MAG TPA: hypothetical protein VJ485_02205 [archaeon]|nr:hypothetical protein [archaeon]